MEVNKDKEEFIKFLTEEKKYVPHPIFGFFYKQKAFGKCYVPLEKTVLVYKLTSGVIAVHTKPAEYSYKFIRTTPIG